MLQGSTMCHRGLVQSGHLLHSRRARYQGSALDDAACASMHVHGRAGKPKQLARYAKNPKQPRELKVVSRAVRRTGQDSNFWVFPQCFWRVQKAIKRLGWNTYGIVFSSKTGVPICSAKTPGLVLSSNHQVCFIFATGK